MKPLNASPPTAPTARIKNSRQPAINTPREREGRIALRIFCDNRTDIVRSARRAVRAGRSSAPNPFASATSYADFSTDPTFEGRTSIILATV